MPGTCARDREQLFLRERRLDEQEIRAGLLVGARAIERRLEALDGARVGAGEDHQVRIHARIHRGLELGHHLVLRDHVLALEVAAAFG